MREILEVVDIGKDVVGSGTTTTETMLQKYPELNCIAAYGDAAAVESSEAAKAAGKSGGQLRYLLLRWNKSGVKRNC